MTAPDFTTVIALDNRCSQQFQQVWPVWKLFCPMLLEHPLLILLDGWMAPQKMDWIDHPDVHFVYWSWRPDLPQRERMLTAFVKIPYLVSTPYWLKIDTDALPVRPGFTIDGGWFDGDPVLVASPWKYTKPGRWINTLKDWAEGIPDLEKHPPLGLRCPEGVTYFGHPRIASWFCFIRTDWSQQVASYCPDRLPVPSQDTYHWYCATRSGQLIRRISFKRLGWVNEPRRTLRAKLVEEMLCKTG